MALSKIERDAYITRRFQEGASYDELYADLINVGAGMDSTIEGELKAVYANNAQQPSIVAPEADSVVDPEAADVTNKYNPYDGLELGENRIMGGYGLTDSAAWLGGKNNTGILNSVGGVVNAGATIGKTYLAYQQFEQNKKDNQKKFELMQEANAMKVLQMKNRVNQANRYAMLGMSNSNNQTATTGIVGSTAYVAPRYSRVG